MSRIDGDALCFDVPETERLFRDAYHQPLDMDVVVDLIDRTEGWAALLSLVHTSLDEPRASDARALVGQLSATHGDLYDFLAEEVIAGLSEQLERFLTHVSILTAVAPERAALVDSGSPDEIARHIAEAEAMGLLMRPDRGQPHRFHPLVRDFLQSRLVERVGSLEVKERHRAVGAALVGTDWGASAWHFAAAGDSERAGRIVDGAIPLIIASGQFDQALPYLDGSAGATDRPGALVLRSRLELRRGNLEQAKVLAQAAVRDGRDGSLEGTCLLNLASLLGVAGFEEAAVDCARQALACELSPAQRLIAKATIDLWDAANEGDLVVIADDLRMLAAHQSRDGHYRHSGISGLNLSSALLWIGDAREAATAATKADSDLVGSDATSVERVAALAARARAMAHLGQVQEAEQTLRIERTSPSTLSRDEASLELAAILCDFGSMDSAAATLARVDYDHLTGGYRGAWAMVRGHLAIRTGDAATASRMCARLLDEPCRDVAGKLRSGMLRARTAIATGSTDALTIAEELGRVADAQRSRIGRRWADLLAGVSRPGLIHEEVLRVGFDDGPCLSTLAEELAANLHRMSTEARSRVEAEAIRLPIRWREALRRSIEGGGPSGIESARLLSLMGSTGDAEYLRTASAGRKALRPFAVALIRKLAPPVYIEDLGQVRVLIGGSHLAKVLRRKVLGLLCFISSRQGMAATRDEALEALWPELGPDTAANSLHQTIYYLRRVFEPGYREGLSAGYVLFDGEVVSLNADLVDSASRRCWKTMDSHAADSQEGAAHLLQLYRGRYALDFTYEDWASSYRENLHAAILARCEAVISAGLNLGRNRGGDPTRARSPGNRSVSRCRRTRSCAPL